VTENPRDVQEQMTNAVAIGILLPAELLSRNRRDDFVNPVVNFLVIGGERGCDDGHSKQV